MQPKEAQTALRYNEALFIGGCQLSLNIVDNPHFRSFCQHLFTY